MKLTRNGNIFILANIVVAGLFYSGVDYLGAQTGDRSGVAMGVSALLAAALLFGIALLLLHYENERRQRVNLGLVYHLITVVVATLGWAVAYALSDYIQPIDLAWIAVISGGSLAAHRLLTLGRAKGINSKKAFL